MLVLLKMVFSYVKFRAKFEVALQKKLLSIVDGSVKREKVDDYRWFIHEN